METTVKQEVSTENMITRRTNEIPSPPAHPGEARQRRLVGPACPRGSLSAEAQAGERGLSLRGEAVAISGDKKMKLTDAKLYALIAVALSVVGLYGLGAAFSQNMVSRQRIESLERELAYLKGQNAKVGKQAADFSLEPVANSQIANRGKISLSSFKGREVVLYAWAPKCPYCKAIETDVQKFYQSTLASRLSPIAFLSVVIPSGREKPNDIVAFMKQNKLSYPALLSDDTFLSGYAPFGTPCLWHIGKDGNIKGVYEGKPTVLAFLANSQAAKSQ